MDIELRLLRYFVAVAEELHFGRAAERLHMAQPPLSMAVKSLEERLGVELFERTRRRVALTEAGRVFLDEARGVLAAAEHAVSAARAASQGQVGRVRVGFVASAPFNVLPDMLRGFRERAPGVAVTLTEMTTSQQVAALHEGRIDIGLARLPVDSSGLEVRLLLQEPLMVALPDGHPRARQRRIEARQLASEPFIMFPRTVGAGLYDLIIGVCVAAGFSPTIAHEVSLMQTIVGLVGAGLGVALVPESIRLIHGTGVAYRPLVDSPRVEMGVIWRSDDRSPVLRRLVRDGLQG